MSTDSNNPHKLSFSTRCLPGSVAEQEETERLAEFHRSKAKRQADEAHDRQQAAARREQAYRVACDANKERMTRDKAARAERNGFLRP